MYLIQLSKADGTGLLFSFSVVNQMELLRASIACGYPLGVFISKPLGNRVL